MTLQCDRCAYVREQPQTTFTVETAFGRKANALQPLFSVELLVLTKQQHTISAGPFSRMDKALGGALTAAMDREDFGGALGEHLLVEVHVPDQPLKRVLIVGMGNPGEGIRPNFCGMYRLAIDVANQLGFKNLGIPVWPGRLTADFMNIKGMLAVLHCRAAERLRSTAEPTLKEIKVFCTAQARRHVEQGLAVDHQLCVVCRDPRICS
ncbi:MAG: hypothetical protein EKK48_09985 [Candidatus Melainabacteria bacterium]|nr:MAG: hypothetical protein EKK48_09985 [Candidatus Melainabacteria bacterium]